ncbi:MAG: VanZ family protein [Clostridia bacterium]|nr:VanZ family protein [Clostridia bacterium]
MSKRSFKTWRIIFSALYIGLAIFAIVQAVLPGETSAAESRTFTSITTQTIFGEEVETVKVLNNSLTFKEFTAFLRKVIGHFAYFAAMGIFGFLALFRSVRTKKVVIIDLLATFFVAGLTEFLQIFLPTRVGLFSDFVLDGQGAIAAIAISCAVIAVRSKLNKGKRRPYLLYYVALPAIVFSILFMIFNADNLNAYFCFMLYFLICAASLVTIAVATHE